MNIFVGNLSFNTTEPELQKEFEAFGEVRSVKIILDHETRKSRGFGFVEMPDSEQANAAIAGMNGKVVAGQILKVNEAKPKEARSGPPRERSGPPRERSGGYGSGGRSSGWSGFGPGDRDGQDIYDSKGFGGRGRGGRGSGGRSGGGGRRTPR